MNDNQPTPLRPGVCIPWEERKQEYPQLLGDEELVKKVWEEIDTLGYLYIWFCLIAF